VRLDPGKVAMPADLRVLGALPIDRHGAVGHDERDFLVRRGVLEMLSLAVQWDFFFETLDLFSRLEVSTEAEFGSLDVCDQDAEGLAGPARGADRTGVREFGVGATVPVPVAFHF